MKLKYDVVTGEVICMGEMPDLSGDGVVDVSFGIPSEPLNHFTFNGSSLIRKEQSVIDAIEAERKFSFHLLMGDLNQSLEPQSILKLAPYKGALESFCDWKNWAGVRNFIDALVLSQIATISEANQIKSAFSDQGIIL